MWIYSCNITKGNLAVPIMPLTAHLSESATAEEHEKCRALQAEEYEVLEVSRHIINLQFHQHLHSSTSPSTLSVFLCKGGMVL